MSDIIKIEHLNKCFGDVKAVNDLSFRVKKGELFAFLGVNGAGKSTTISIICGQLRKDSGNVWIKDKEADRAGSETKRLLGVVFQDSVLDKPLTVKENLKSRAALYGITGNSFEKRLAELVEILDFGDYINRPVGKLSDKSIMSLVAETKESLYTFAKNVAYKTIRITGVIIDENNIPLSLKKSFLFLLTSAVISFITNHLPIFSQSQQEIHRPYHLLRLHNHGISPDVSQSFS